MASNKDRERLRLLKLLEAEHKAQVAERSEAEDYQYFKGRFSRRRTRPERFVNWNPTRGYNDASNTNDHGGNGGSTPNQSH